MSSFLVAKRFSVSTLMLLSLMFSLSAQEPMKVMAQKQPASIDSISISHLPKIIYLEHSTNNEYLNFEISIKNHHKRQVFLREIEGLIYDKGNKLIRKIFYNPNQRPSLEFVNRRGIAPGDSTLLFNPFHTIENDSQFDHMKVNLTFTDSLYHNYEKLALSIKPRSYNTKTIFGLPLKGEVLIWEGHDYYSNHRRLDYFRPHFAKQGINGNFQRFAYDFVVVDSNGSMYNGAQKNESIWYNHIMDNNTDYYCFGKTVFAAADGLVEEIHDGEPDNRSFDAKRLKLEPKAYGGNYIIIRHGNKEYSWYSHLKQGSILLKSGEKIKKGQPIAHVGASGSALFPHLHFEFRDGSGVSGVEGLPILFSDIPGKGTKKILLAPGTILKN
jgi:hypothetical protein